MKTNKEPTGEHFRDLVRQNYELIVATPDSGFTYSMHRHLALEIVTKRAQVGEGIFDVNYPNARLAHIIDCVPGMSLEGVRDYFESQVSYVEQVLQGAMQYGHRAVQKAIEKSGPLLGIRSLEEMSIDDERFLEGFMISGLWDTFYWRRQTRESFPIALNGQRLEIGGGDFYHVNADLLYELAEKDPELRKRNWSRKMLSDLRRMGVVVDQAQEGTEQIFVHRESGRGISDDLGHIAIGRHAYEDNGRKAAFSAMAGSIIGDGLDTLFSLYLNGTRRKDIALAKAVYTHLCERMGEDVIKRKITSTIYLAAKANSPEETRSSSFRALVKGRGTDTRYGSYMRAVTDNRRFARRPERNERGIIPNAIRRHKAMQARPKKHRERTRRA